MAAVGLKGGHTLGNLLGNEISFTIDDTDRNYKGNVSVFDSNLKAVVISELNKLLSLINFCFCYVPQLVNLIIKFTSLTSRILDN